MSEPRLLVDVSPFEGGDVLRIEGTAADLFQVLSSYLARHGQGVCLSYPYGAACGELRLMPGRSLAVNLAEAWDEATAPGALPISFDGGDAEREAALYLVRALMDAGPRLS